MIIIRNNYTWCSKFIDVENRLFQYVQCVSQRGNFFRWTRSHLASRAYIKITVLVPFGSHLVPISIWNTSNINSRRNPLTSSWYLYYINLPFLVAKMALLVKRTVGRHIINRYYGMKYDPCISSKNVYYFLHYWIQHQLCGCIIQV